MGRYSGKKCRLLSMFSLTVTFFLVEIIVGHVTNSMALIADSFHMLSDIAALVIAFISVKMAPKSWDKNTYGWARAEVLGKPTKAKISCIILLRTKRMQLLHAKNCGPSLLLIWEWDEMSTKMTLKLEPILIMIMRKQRGLLLCNQNVDLFFVICTVDFFLEFCFVSKNMSRQNCQP